MRACPTIVIAYGRGGLVDEHRQRFADYRSAGAKVKITGPCYSAWVEGDISPFGFSDHYLRQDNPFRTGEKDSFKGGTKVAVVAPAAAVAAPPAGLLQIGRKTYGGEA